MWFLVDLVGDSLHPPSLPVAKLRRCVVWDRGCPCSRYRRSDPICRQADRPNGAEDRIGRSGCSQSTGGAGWGKELPRRNHQTSRMGWKHFCSYADDSPSSSAFRTSKLATQTVKLLLHEEIDVLYPYVLSHTQISKCSFFTSALPFL